MSNTYKSSYTGAQIDEAVSKILNGISGDCTAPHVITVPELPTEGIDENAVYKCGDIYYRYGDEKTLSNVALKVFYNEPAEYAHGTPFEFYYVKEKPKSTIARAMRLADSGMPIFIPMYYVENENDIFVYTSGFYIGEEDSEGAAYVQGWLTLGQLISILNQQVTVPEYTFQGCISSIDEAENVGYYAIIGTKKDWKSYGHPCVIKVDELPAIETRDDTALYCISEEECVDVGIYDADGQYMSIILILSAILEVPVQIFNVPTLDVVADPIPYPLAFYYCKADRMLYSWDDEKGKWDACDGKDEDSLGIPGWQTVINTTYYKSTAGGFTDLIIAESPFQLSYKELIPSVTFHTIDKVPDEITDEYELTYSEFAAHIYYAEQDNDVGAFAYKEGTSERIWFSIIDEMNLPDEATFGVVTDRSEIPVDSVGLYVVISPPWEKYILPRGTRILFEPGKVIDVREIANVIMDPNLGKEKYTGRVVYE